MCIEIDQNGLEVLERDECFRLLAGANLGRVGLSLAALPSVIPVSYCLSDDRILVGTGPVSQLEPLIGAVVAFEVDEFDPLYRSGWSVVINGRATEVIDDGEGHVIAISTEFVKGRRLLPA